VPFGDWRVVSRAESSDLKSPAYILGRSEQELGRLARQSKLIDPITRRFFEAAGLGEGMRVLDIGSGAGHVTAIAAEIVGPSGEVVGVDRSSDALDSARALMETKKLRNVTFVGGDASAMSFEKSFDAVVGRYVLQFQTEPASMIRALLGHVRPGGIVVFHELDWTGARSTPKVPLYDQSCRWILETIQRNGVEGHMGTKLHAAYLAAGLPPPALALESILGNGEDEERIRLVTDVIGTLQESIVAAGFATAAEIDLATLPQRIAAQALGTRSVLVCRSEIGAWSRVPA